MGEARKEASRVDFDSQVKLEFHGASVISDAGLVAYRELDEALGLTRMANDIFRDPRRGKNTPHELTAMLRQAVYSRLAGYEDTNDAERLSIDPAMRQVVGGRAKKKRQGGIHQSDGPFGDGDPDSQEEPEGHDGTVRDVDRPRSPTLRPGQAHPRPGQFGE